MQSVDLYALLPKNVEDEFILEDTILEANPTDTCKSLHGNGLPRFHKTAYPIFQLAIQNYMFS
jgi:hypothetical protein